MRLARAYRCAITRLRRARRVAGRAGRATVAGLLVALVGLQGLPVSAFAAPSTPVVQLTSTAAVVQTPPGSQVIDYTGGGAASLAGRLKRTDVGIVVRYVGAAKWKSLTRTEA